LKISRLDLDGAGLPMALVARILQVEPDLPIPVPIEALCERFDIVSIEELHTEGFEAALITDPLKANGGILVKAGVSPERRRFSIAHELGHFLIPTHSPPEGGEFLCSAADLWALARNELDRRVRMEVEANQFAALLLIPPPALRTELRRRALDLAQIVRLAKDFEVSREAMARACVDHTVSAVAIIVVRNGTIQRMYRRDGRFPFILAGRGQRVPNGSAFHDVALSPGSMTQMDECEPEVWLSDRSARVVELFEEQILFQQNGYAMILLRAELHDDD